MTEKDFGDIRRYFKREDLKAPVKRWEEYRTQFVNLLPSGGKVLDIGSSTGEDSHFFAEQGLKVVAGDIVPEKLKQAGEAGRKGQRVVMDINRLGLSNNSVEGMWMANVFGFTKDEDKEQILRKCHQVLKPGGKLFLCDNFFPGSKAEAFLIEKTGKDPLYSSYRVRKMLDTVGFTTLSEDIGVNIPGKESFADRSGFYTVLAEKSSKKK